MYLAWQAYRRGKRISRSDLVRRALTKPCRPEQDALTVLKILVQQAQSDPMVPTSRIFSSKAFPFGFIPSALHGWQGSYEGYSWLLQQDHIFVDIDEIKGKYPAPWHIQVIVRPEKANLIFEALFDDKIAPEITETPDLLFWSVISCVCFAIDWVPERDIFPKFHSIYELVKRGCDVHGKKDSWMVHEKRTILYNLLACHKFYLVSTTPLSLPNQVSSHLAFDTELYLKLAADEYLATTGDGSSKQKTEREAIFQAIFRRQNTEERMRRNIIRAWFEILLSCGINLHDYARTEEKFYRKRTICTGSAPLGYFLDIQFSFQYGPTPEDLEISWQDIWFRDPSYTPVPGAWEDEDYEVHSTIRLLAEYCVSNQLKPTMDGPSGKYSLEKSSNVE